MESWWGTHTLVNGVFKGGGAKGIAYAGALEAMAKRGWWFGSVAGASAGAITASLIAAGCTPDQLMAFVPKLLASIKKRRVKMVVGLGTSWFDGSELRQRLEEIYAAQVGRPADLSDPITFDELHEATGISLYVVSLDLSRAAPVVFSVHTTPGISVSGAVMASSAIPVGFPSIRALFKSEDSEVWVQRLVDGGGWSNLPRFVYYDPSFAAWVMQNHPTVSLTEERSRKTICFALGVDNTEPIKPDVLTLQKSGYPKFDRGTTQDLASWMYWVMGGLFSSQKLRAMIAVSLCVVLVIGLLNVHSNVDAILFCFDWRIRVMIAPVVSGVYLAAIVLGFLLSFAIVAFGKPLGDVLIPSVRAALAAGTGVAPWVGAAEDDHIIRLDPAGLETADFAPSEDVQLNAVRDARERTLYYLDERLPAQVDVTPETMKEERDDAEGPAVEEYNRWKLAQRSPKERLDSLLKANPIFKLMTPTLGWADPVTKSIRPTYVPFIAAFMSAVGLALIIYTGYLFAYHGNLNWGYEILPTSILLLIYIGFVIMMIPWVARWHRAVAQGDMSNLTARGVKVTIIVALAMSIALVIWGTYTIFDYIRSEKSFASDEVAQVRVLNIEDEPGLTYIKRVTLQNVDGQDAPLPVVMSGSWAIGSTPKVGDTVFVRYYTENGSRSFLQVAPPEPFGLLILGAGIALAAVATTPYQVLRRRAQLLKIKS